ncbi:MAG TPA: 50S ribosomal protein L18 [Planctomycetes bacterium]|nr:50S ribosomal protein L18 [Planctomycetota bacterium]
MRLLKKRKRTQMHVRSRLRRESTRPRLSVFRSHKNISAQIIDDLRGETLVMASSLDKGMRDLVKGKPKSEVATEVGKRLGELAKEKGISKVVFDRGYYKFHGRVKALAEAARQAGLEF